jgi:hypothetical protein
MIAWGLILLVGLLAIAALVGLVVMLLAGRKQ